MLTRIEIDGFKTFEGFVLDLQPFSAVVGPNASGKSSTLFARVAQRQTLDALRGSRSFRAFETALRVALIDLGSLPRQR